MTTELEKQFFDTFKIKKGKICKYHNCKCPLFDTSSIKSACPEQKVLQKIPTGYGTKNCSLIVEEYPQITDRHYLELIVLLSGVCCMNFAFERSLGEMKYKILKITMEYKKLLKHQVQAIFKGKR